jgi:hypothetical protein
LIFSSASLTPGPVSGRAPARARHIILWRAGCFQTAVEAFCTALLRDSSRYQKPSDASNSVGDRCGRVCSAPRGDR